MKDSLENSNLPTRTANTLTNIVTAQMS